MIFVETIRIENGICQNLPQHEERMIQTLNAHSKIPKWENLAALVSSRALAYSGVVKCRVIYQETISQLLFEQYTPQKIHSLQLVDGGTIDYAFKYLDRSNLEALKAKRGNCDDVWIVKNNFLTDTSYTNVILFDGSSYYTSSKFLLNGIQRQLLIKEGKIHEIPLQPKDLPAFEKIFLINTMLNWETKIELPMNQIKR